jgi:anti-sigma factor ChrR (cupin superfamily)
MTPHIDDSDLLDLSPGTAEYQHLETCPRCRAAADEALAAFHLMALSLPPIAPPAELRVQLLAATAGPITDHAAPLAEMFGRPESEVLDLLTRVRAGEARWSALLPGIDHHSIKVGDGRRAGLFRLAPGVHFPHHRHLGDERLRVLQGSCTDSSGLVLGPGDELSSAGGTAHALISHRGPPLLLAYIGGGTELTGLSL